MEKSSFNVTERHARFVDEYMINLNVSQAAAAVGVSVFTGRKYLTHPWVVAEIEERKKAKRDRTEIEADYVIQTIRDTIERCRQATPVLDRKGIPVLIENSEGALVPAYEFRPAEVLRGCELLGKHLGIFTENINIKQNMPTVVVNASIEELQLVVQQMLKEI